VVVVVVLVKGTGVERNMGTAEIGRHGCFSELVWAVVVAIIAIKIYAQIAEWFSTCCVCGWKGPEFDSHWSHLFFQCQYFKYI
jgi:hypothetical protein